MTADANSLTPQPGRLFDLSGRLALVTGASRGLGFAMARGLIAQGAEVLVNGRAPEAVDAACAALGSAARPLVFDASDPATVDQAFARIRSDYGRLDILISNTAASLRSGFEAIPPEGWARVLNASLTAAWHLARAAAPLMREAGEGRMIFTSSVNARIVRNEMAAYAAAKAGLEGLVRALAVELAPDRITVNAIAPGYFATEGNAPLRARPGMTDKIAGRVALGRWGNPDELAGAAVYLAAPSSTYTTGHTLTVDGGLTLTI